MGTPNGECPVVPPERTSESLYDEDGYLDGLGGGAGGVGAGGDYDGQSVDEDSLITTERYDWEKEKQKKLQFYDDGTMSYFW